MNPKNIEKNIRLLRKKIAAYQEELLREGDPGRKVTYEEEILQLENDLRKEEVRLGSLYDVYTPEGAGLLRDYIKQLDITPPLGLWHLVNCNRTDDLDCFWEEFDSHHDQIVQHYLISACSTQMPDSFSERIIYELIIEELEDDEVGIWIDRKQQSGRVHIHKLPFGRNLRGCQRRFRKFLAEHFNLGNEKSLESFFKERLTKQSYQYVAMAFWIHQQDWKAHLLEYIQWIGQMFKELATGPKLMLFFVVKVDGLHKDNISSEQQSIIDSLESLTNQPATSHLCRLYPVNEQDLIKWVMDVGENNPSRIERAVKLLAKGLSGDDRKQYENQKAFNMDDVERFQELVYQVAQEQQQSQMRW